MSVLADDGLKQSDYRLAARSIDFKKRRFATQVLNLIDAFFSPFGVTSGNNDRRASLCQAATELAAQHSGTSNYDGGTIIEPEHFLEVIGHRYDDEFPNDQWRM